MKIVSQPSTSLNNKTGGWRAYKPKTNLDKCISCGICAKVCPDGIITMIAPLIKGEGGDFSKPKPVTDYDYCKGCGVCAEECPVKAIEMELERK